MNYSTKAKTDKLEHQGSKGNIQAQIDLKDLALFHLGAAIADGAVLTFVIPFFDPDNSEFHIHSTHYRNPATGERGGAIKFIQRLKRFSYAQAIAYLEGWHDAKQSNQFANHAEAVQLPPKPIQLNLFTHTSKGRR